jgi:hypothetical protein
LAVQIVPAVEGGARNANLFHRPPHATDVLHDLCRRFFSPARISISSSLLEKAMMSQKSPFLNPPNLNSKHR